MYLKWAEENVRSKEHSKMKSPSRLTRCNSSKLLGEIVESSILDPLFFFFLLFLRAFYSPLLSSEDSLCTNFQFVKTVWQLVESLRLFFQARFVSFEFKYPWFGIISTWKYLCSKFEFLMRIIYRFRSIVL